jgi:phage tail-like protein
MADKNTQFPVNSYRYDPYKNFKFQVWWDGRCVAGDSRVSALKMSTEAVSHREGNDPSTARVSPSTWSFEPITLERGVTHDPEFEQWAKLCWTYSEKDPTTYLASFRKSVQIKLLNEEGQVAKAYNVYRCWVSEYQALPELDANGNAVAIESMVLQNEGWERDLTVSEPKETAAAPRPEST